MDPGRRIFRHADSKATNRKKLKMKTLLTITALAGVLMASSISAVADNPAELQMRASQQQVHQIMKTDAGTRMMCEEIINDARGRKMMVQAMLNDPACVKLIKKQLK
ncbi:MAG: hypothetical protein M3O82_05730 [Verrucomicrobiota bacterium]|nr:hypothetical protein [Verrucomicrobiota bacterium]